MPSSVALSAAVRLDENPNIAQMQCVVVGLDELK